MTEDPVIEQTFIDVGDDVRLAATLYLPEHLPAAVILEALPYRKDDITAYYRPEYKRLCHDHGYAVCRVDLRGTGSSTGIPTDEYPATEIDDLRAVIAWLATRPWCTGAVGMYGASYSGFNSLQVAATRPDALRAIIAIYATDDRYTDDVHYRGGVKKAIDVVDYEAYMVAMNALPPVPAVFGPGWREEWAQRIEQAEPWIIEWLRHPLDGAYWRPGSLRPEYDRIGAATMLIGGWADGYRNNSLRTFAALKCPRKLLMGPWAHMSTATSRPGPRIDAVPVMARWWDRWLRDEPNGLDDEPPITFFSRHSTRLHPALDDVEGAWRTERTWPLPPERSATWRRDLGYGTELLAVRPDVGALAGIDCAGHLPYGQPTDQRADDARSITTDWKVGDEPIEVLGHGRAWLRLRATTPVAFVAVKLCDVAPGGWSSLVARGFVNPSPWVPGQWRDVDVEIEATSWRFAPGHLIRVTVAGTDWPNTLPPPAATTLEVDRAASSIELPLIMGVGQPNPDWLRRSESRPPAIDGTIARIERDSTSTRYCIEHGDDDQHYRGEVEVSDDFASTSTSDVSFTLRWPEATVTSAVHLELRSDATHHRLRIDLDVAEHDGRVWHRAWHEEFPRADA